MGLIGANCGKCQAAASAADGGGLAGTWWRGWAKVSGGGTRGMMLNGAVAKANENSGYIGAAIVGTFIVTVGGWYGMRRLCMIF